MPENTGVQSLHTRKYRGPKSTYQNIQESKVYIPDNIWVQILQTEYMFGVKLRKQGEI